MKEDRQSGRSIIVAQSCLRILARVFMAGPCMWMETSIYRSYS